ncbi:hypothetical protein BCR42DRAFT_446744 [Absidia repens]|uniref:Uncharacterized protein n=1 Tax=Absidia repens TaxID=90262 RepID=A0A1X2IVD3_9FUNG|nr:hypothetical protein BCR42DRAFT_446744 [Absidia repens]
MHNEPLLTYGITLFSSLLFQSFLETSPYHYNYLYSNPSLTTAPSVSSSMVVSSSLSSSLSSMSSSSSSSSDFMPRFSISEVSSSPNMTYTFCPNCGVDTSIFSHEDHCSKARQL